MTQRNKERHAHRTKSRIPQFKSREEEAKWFDTHDMGDYQDEFKPVRVRFAKNLSEGLTIQFDPETITKLRLRARERGLGPTQLARMWILEHLQDEYEKTKAH